MGAGDRPSRSHGFRLRLLAEVGRPPPIRAGAFLVLGGLVGLVGLVVGLVGLVGLVVGLVAP